MAKRAPRDRAANDERQQFHPTGGVVTIDGTERSRLKAGREAKELTQGQLAKRIGVTPATISNIETGRHPQVKKTVYAKLVRALFGKDDRQATETSDLVFTDLVASTMDLSVDQQLALLAIARTLKNTR